MTKTRYDTPEKNAQALVVERHGLPLFWYDLYNVLLSSNEQCCLRFGIVNQYDFSSVPVSSHLPPHPLVVDCKLQSVNNSVSIGAFCP
jgi:hypothetical protein